MYVQLCGESAVFHSSGNLTASLLVYSNHHNQMDSNNNCWVSAAQTGA